ncbi:unnamed protein product [Rotaria magnacalcarata]|uniref:Uncharacterized protein n=1 Tax=Rotaria magnacalcarata TaxID=392030 RepID=A0A820NN76_9BILA|nr:unnamed protein product [Rotaria magnacalcarata]
MRFLFLNIKKSVIPRSLFMWSVIEKRKKAVLARRRQQQHQQQQIDNVEQPMIIQPQSENPPQPKIKEKVLTIKLKGIMQVKRSYEHISSENVTGENIINTTNDKNIKRKTSNNKKCLNTNVYSKDTQLALETEREFDSECAINNNINDIGLQQIDQLHTFETESCLNQIVVTAEIHNNPDYEPVLNIANENRNENPSNTGTDISVAIEPSAAINDLNTVNTVDSLESINLTNNDGSISNNQAPTPDCFNEDLDLNGFIIGSREIACTETFFINESIIDVNKKYSRVDIKYTINVKNVWHMHKKTADDNILEIFEDFLHHINLSINEYFSRVGRTGFVQFN